MNQMNKKLNVQLRVEKDAFKLYDFFIKKIDNPNIKKDIIKIRDDEKEHIMMVEEMIYIMKEYKAKAKIAKIEAKRIDLSGFVNEFKNLFVITAVGDYTKTIIEIIGGLSINCIYLSFNKMPWYIERLLRSNQLDTKKIRFISCVNSPERKGITVNPEDLTGISLTIEKLMQKMEGRCFILVDTISSFSVYHSANAILKFIGLVNSKLEKYSCGVI